MNLTINNYNGLNLLIAEGSVEEAGLKMIAEELNQIPSTAEKHVILDCSGIKKLIQNGTGFSGFINHLLYIKSKQASITLFGCDNQTKKLLKLLKLESTFQFAPTLDEAYLNLNRTFNSIPATAAS